MRVERDTVFIEVPPEYVGMLIGEMGANVKYVEGKAGCKVRILVKGNVGKEVLREAAKLRRKTDALIQALLEA
ncbi:MAG: KH domain-containing protein [Candidatus Korarchaeum sp.]